MKLKLNVTKVTVVRRGGCTDHCSLQLPHHVAVKALPGDKLKHWGGQLHINIATPRGCAEEVLAALGITEDQIEMIDADKIAAEREKPRHTKECDSQTVKVLGCPVLECNCGAA